MPFVCAGQSILVFMELYIRVGWHIVLSIVLKSKGIDNTFYLRRLNHLYSIGIWGRDIYAQIVRNVAFVFDRKSFLEFLYEGVSTMFFRGKD